MPKKLIQFLNFFRASSAERLPISPNFWLYFFVTTTVILALTSGYFVVKLEKIQEFCPCDIESHL